MKLTENDYIIVLGDMGLFWRNDKKDSKAFIQDFESKFNFNLYFVEGNHENFKLLNKLEEDENKMGHISEHIKHLKRGYVYNIEDKKILTIGGADSIDKFRRQEGLNWWREETITDDDISRINIDYYDYVLTHTCPVSILEEYRSILCTLGDIVDNNNPEYKISNNKLEQVKNFIDFGHWFFGHMHIDQRLNDKFTCLLDSFVELK